MKIKPFLNQIASYISYNLCVQRPFNKPLILQIETTNKCNISCSICPRQKMSRKQGTMELKDFKKIINSIAKDVNLLKLYHYGEPLLDPTLSQKIRYCTDFGIKTNIITNAVLLNEIISIKLLESGLTTLVIDFDGHSKQSYESIRRGANFENVRNNIEQFMKLRDKYKTIPNVILKFIPTDKNKHEVKEFEQYWKKYNFSQIKISHYHTWSSSVSSQKYLSQNDQVPCFFLWHSYIILWNGDIIKCCMDYNGDTKLGNIFVDDYKKLWLMDSSNEDRKNHLHYIFKGMCKDCKDMPPVKPTPIFINNVNLKRIREYLNTKR